MSRINKKDLNPIFHRRDKSEDNEVLSRAMVKQVRKTGILNLHGKALTSVPEKVWNINSPDDDKEIDLVFESKNLDDNCQWWQQKTLTNLDLSSNHLSGISGQIANLSDLTVLNLHDNALTAIPPQISKLTRLVKCNLSHNKIQQLPTEFYKLSELKQLNLSHNEFVEMPAELCDLVMLEILDLSYNQLTSLPSGIGFLIRLDKLLLSHNHLVELPSDIVNLRILHHLDLMNNDLKSLPARMGELRKVECIYAQHNDIVDLPDFTGCDNLKELHISNNFIQEIVVDFCESVPHLKILDLRDNKIEKLPDEIAMLQKLIRLDLSNNSILSLPSSLATLAHLTSLQVEGNPIRSIRRDVIQCGTQRILKVLRARNPVNLPEMKTQATISDGDTDATDFYKMRKSHTLSLTMKNLSEISDNTFMTAQEADVNVIDLSRNKLAIVPDGLSHMEAIAIEVNLSHNLLTKLPSFIGQFSRLSELNISSNQLSSLPDELGLLRTLRELNLSNNKFKLIPDSVYNLCGLENLLANDNQIEQIDAIQLRQLPRLATLDLTNNNIDNVPPILGNLKLVRLGLDGNPFRQPRQQILIKGTDAIMSYLRDRIPK